MVWIARSRSSAASAWARARRSTSSRSIARASTSPTDCRKSTSSALLAGSETSMTGLPFPVRTRTALGSVPRTRATQAQASSTNGPRSLERMALLARAATAERASIPRSMSARGGIGLDQLGCPRREAPQRPLLEAREPAPDRPSGEERRREDQRHGPLAEDLGEVKQLDQAGAGQPAGQAAGQERRDHAAAVPAADLDVGPPAARRHH